MNLPNLLNITKELNLHGLNLTPHTIARTGLPLFYRGQVILNTPAISQNIAVDTYSYIGQGCEFNNISCGRYCSIGPNVKAGEIKQDLRGACTSPIFIDSQDFDFAFVSPKTMHLTTNKEKTHHAYIEIGHDVWIGSNVLIANDLKIGTGAVVGASAVITKDVPPYAIVVGHDRHIKNRFSDELISDLLESQWWQYDIPAISRLGVDFPFTKPHLWVQRLKTLAPKQLKTIEQHWMTISAS